ncbi:hypothetical protein H4R34_002557 [Dimargaris verticillata]|uniref:PPM-type phosphatase domain-containing protein n=1 Tax=Dimargaris verticillata TaxID=2761393 RepID=A0A9W8B995_9FUNG|nr:hypothetical protein H4R34_002557 [Dimargaris verticillata]
MAEPVSYARSRFTSIHANHSYSSKAQGEPATMASRTADSSPLGRLLTSKWTALTLVTGLTLAYMGWPSKSLNPAVEYDPTIRVPLGRSFDTIPVRCDAHDDDKKHRMAWRARLPAALAKFAPITAEEVNATLVKNQQSFRVDDPANRIKRQDDAVDASSLGAGAATYPSLVFRYDTNQVPSNSPIEDHHREWVMPFVQIDSNGPPSSSSNPLAQPGRWLMFGVFDGHSGYQCSRKVAHDLPLHIQRALNWTDPTDVPQPALAPAASVLEKSEGTKRMHALSAQQLAAIQHMQAALTTGFITMDNELIQGSLQNFINHPDRPQEMLYPAVAGSCGLVASVDTALRQVSVACTGDSRVVLGSLNPRTGEWTAIPLSTDQTAGNPAEVKRLLTEHPNEESTVLQRGRILGSLQPTRAFGDARYKWPETIQAQIYPTQFPGRRATPKYYQTPPYVTAVPEVTHHALNQNDKFLVVASDGLYDELSSAEVVQAVAEFWEAKMYNNAQPSPPTTSSGVVDDNAATHVIRRALGGQDHDIIGRLLAIPAPQSRRYRDDITVTVVFFS